MPIIVEKDKTLREIQDEVAALRIAFGYLGSGVPQEDIMRTYHVIMFAADNQGFNESVSNKLKFIAEQIKGNADHQNDVTF